MPNYSFPFDSPLFIAKALRWAANQSYCAYLNPCGIQHYPNGPFKHVLASGARRIYKHDSSSNNTFDAVARFQQGGWLFGFWGYDLKNETEKLHSHNPDRLPLPDCLFFEPEVLLFFEADNVNIEANYPDAIFEQINQISIEPNENEKTAQDLSKSKESKITFQCDVSQKEYIRQVQVIRENIAAGEVYELNYCLNFWAEARIDPLAIYEELVVRSPAPFSCFVKMKEKYLLGSSPERFLKKTGRRLVSQPIKGTARRGSTPQEDEKLKYDLRHSQKEMAENMMIVDLVRNDLARSAVPGSIEVEEMFGIYSFAHVHQMISTVVATLPENTGWQKAIKKAFPMGSMTGAPKIRAMQLIEELETFKRGLYSGAVGYISPEQDFDFNVVIRSLIYDQQKGLLSLSAGGAITWDSVPEQEYEECLLKAKALMEVANVYN